jgi:hypothetical protein
MHETGHRYRLKYNFFVIVLFVRRITVSVYLKLSMDEQLMEVSVLMRQSKQPNVDHLSKNGNNDLPLSSTGLRDCVRMVVGFITTYAINSYHH